LPLRLLFFTSVIKKKKERTAILFKNAKKEELTYAEVEAPKAPPFCFVDKRYFGERVPLSPYFLKKPVKYDTI